MTGPVRALLDGVRELAAIDPTALPGPVALAEVSVLLSLESQLAAIRLARLADLDHRDLPVLSGATSTAAWLQQQPVPARREQLALARRLDRLPHLSAAVSSGRLSLSAAEHLGRTLERTRRLVDRPGGLIDGHPGEAVISNLLLRGVLQLLTDAVGGYADDDPRFDAHLQTLLDIAGQVTTQQDRLERACVHLAEHLPPGLLPAALDRLLDALRPQHLDAAAARAHDLRELTLRLDTDGAGYTLARAKLTLELGETLVAVIAAEMATDPDNPTDSAAWRARHHLDNEADTAAAAHTAQGKTGAEDDAADLPGADGAENGTGADADAADLPGANAADGLQRLAIDWAGQTPRPPRTLAQRRHDALLLGLRRLLDSGVLGTRDKAAPHLAVTVTLDTLNALPGALPALSPITGTRLPTSYLQAQLCRSRITRLIMTLWSVPDNVDADLGCQLLDVPES